MNKKKLIPIILLCVFLIICIFLGSGVREYSLHTDSVMDTYADITVITDKNGEEIVKKISEILEEYDKKLSHTEEGSEVSQLNNSYSEEVSEDTYEIIEKCGDFFEDTGGSFDITVGAVCELWSRAFESGVLPSANEISDGLETVGYASLELDSENKRTAITKTGQKINLGAVAKGYAEDKVREYVDEMDVDGVLVNFGGSVWVKGKNKNGEPWRVGVRDPKSEADILLSLSLSDKFIITSGSYIRFCDIDEVRYHHIIDAKTGYPVQNKLTGVTIVTDSGFVGDALSTSCFLLGLDEGRKLAEKYDAEAVFVTNDNKVYYSRGLEKALKKLSSDYEYIPF